MSDFEDIFTSLRSERGVNRDSVISAIEASLLAAYTASDDAKSAAYARAIFDPATGSMQIERLIDPDFNSAPGQDFRKAATAQYLAIDQHAVTIENDEVGLDHRVRFQPAIRSYTQRLGNNPVKGPKGGLHGL